MDTAMGQSSRSEAPTSGERAVVIGGSMAGLFAARVLADRFGEVVVVDRDRFPAAAEFRKGTPQARHLHVLLARGGEIADRFFPGLTAELVAHGGVRIAWPTDVLWLTARGWARRFAPGIGFVSCQRELLEWAVRRRVAALANVRVREGTEAVGLLATGDGGAVAGVRLRARGAGPDAPLETLAAALVVEASGRNSRLPTWLADLGYGPPREETVDAGLGYATRDYAIPPGFDGGWKAIMLQPRAPRTTRTGYLFQVAPDRWRVSLMGAGGDHPPTDDAGFLAFARSLRSPILAEAITTAEPLTPIHGYANTVNLRRRYDRSERLPERLLVTGDAACAFNPIYGQGMTAAAQASLALDRLLRARTDGDRAGLGRAFHRTVAKANAGAWLLATGEDLRYPSTVGGNRGLATRLTHRYLDRVIRVATEDRSVHFAFLDVVQLVAPPMSLFKPSVLLPSLRWGGEGERSGPPPAVDVARLVPAASLP